MRILAAFERSGKVREAMRAKGHDAWSCDIVPADDGSPFHLQMDVRGCLAWNWDLIIAFPPCTFLCGSGVRWLKGNRKRQRQQRESVELIWQVYDAPCKKVCIENPIGMLSSLFRKPNQIVQPWMFGHPENKATCFWLRGLPNLEPTKNVHKQMLKLPKHVANRIHYMGNNPNRAKDRSETFQGIADAMAEQWGAIKP